ncbi:MAG: type II secretion system F family protein [Verrucomicrobiota bacterium]
MIELPDTLGVVWVGGFLWAVLWRLALMLGICGVLFYIVYFLISLPMRRRERARLFLDLLETGLKNGQSAERTVMAIAATRERSVGVRFHLLAAHLEQGATLAQALQRVPRLLPPPAAALLQAGLQCGKLAQVVPACQRLLADGHSQIRKAQQYLTMLGFVTTPVMCNVLVTLSVWVLPKYRAIYRDMLESPAEPVNFLLANQAYLIAAQLLLSLLVLGGMFVYVGGPRVVEAVASVHPRLAHWLSYSSPWQRKRTQRDFSAALAIFLDAGLTEEKAVQLAAEATANPIIQKRAARAVGELQSGAKLAQALMHLDDAGEFHWRLENAAHGKSTFQTALAGWQESLEARAFRDEQSVTQTASTALILANGAMVGMVVICLFMPLIQLVNEAVLW